MIKQLNGVENSLDTRGVSIGIPDIEQEKELTPRREDAKMTENVSIGITAMALERACAKLYFQ